MRLRIQAVSLQAGFWVPALSLQGADSRRCSRTSSSRRAGDWALNGDLSSAGCGSKEPLWQAEPESPSVCAPSPGPASLRETSTGATGRLRPGILEMSAQSQKHKSREGKWRRRGGALGFAAAGRTQADPLATLRSFVKVGNACGGSASPRLRPVFLGVFRATPAFSYLLELCVKPISKAAVQQAAQTECGDGSAHL